MKHDDINYIELLGLIPHIEGGYYKIMYDSKEFVLQKCLPTRYSGQRSFSTSIIYYLEKEDYCCFHRLKSDEIWYYHIGSPLTIHIIDENGEYMQKILGNNIFKKEFFQVTIRAGWIFGATRNNPQEHSLISAQVSPGFVFEDLEISEKNILLKKYPQHQKIINQLCKI